MEGNERTESFALAPDGLRRLAWLPIAVLLATMVASRAAGLRTEYEAHFVATSLNFVTRTLGSMVIVYLAGRSFLARGAPSLLLLGCGVLIWGSAGLVTTALLTRDANLGVTISNIGVWLSALCHLMGAAILLRSRLTLRAVSLWLGAGYLLALGAGGWLTLATLAGKLPVFFVEGQGGTPVRQVVVGSAIVMLVVAALLTRLASHTSSSSFWQWYALALLLIAIGLFGAMIESSLDTVLDWAARAAQYLGGIYMLIAAISSVRETRAWGIPLEYALREAEERLALVVQAAHEGVWDWNIETGVAWYSPRYMEMLGYTGGEIESRATAWRRLLHPDDQERALEVVDAALRGGRRFEVEFRLLHKDGRYVPVLSRGVPVREAGGALTRMVGTHLDLTERNRAEEALRRKDADLAEAQRVAHVGSWYWDAKTDVTIGSDELLRIYGFDPATQTVPDFKAQRGRCYPVEDWERVNAAVQRALETGVGYELDVRALRNGTPIWVATRGEVVRDATGQVVGLRGTVQDDTVRKQADEERRGLTVVLEQRVGELQAVLDAAPIGIWIAHDPECRSITGNAHADRLLGAPPAGNVSRSAPPGDAAVSYRVLRAGTELKPEEMPAQVAAATGQPVPAEALEIRFADGSSVHLLEAAVPLFDGEGRIRGAIAAAADVSQLTRVEEALKAANEQLREIDRRKNEFLAVLSHELRNPLAPIRNSTYILRRAPPGSEQARRAVEVMDRQSDHLTRLVDDLLDVTRIARGKFQLRRSRVDLREIVRRATDDFRLPMEDRGLAFRTELPEGKIWADIDATRITQIVGNLLHNASKFTHRGDEVVLTLKVEGADAEIRLRDTGVGIEPALLPRLFEPFVQGERTLARSEGGLGLGLALVKGVAELHHGTVRAASDGDGRGAEFVVRLPVIEPEPRREGERSATERSLQGRRVLVVDDNMDAAESLAELLRLQGHVAEVAYDGPSALAKLASGEPDVILCDIGLPGMSGYEVARQVRAGSNGKVRLIALTGYAHPEDVQRAVEAGFDAHVAKPPDPDKLARLLS